MGSMGNTERESCCTYIRETRVWCLQQLETLSRSKMRCRQSADYWTWQHRNLYNHKCRLDGTVSMKACWNMLKRKQREKSETGEQREFFPGVLLQRVAEKWDGSGSGSRRRVKISVCVALFPNGRTGGRLYTIRCELPSVEGQTGEVGESRTEVFLH